MPTRAPEAPLKNSIAHDGNAGEPEKAATKVLPVGESVTRGALALLGTQPLTWGSSLLTTIALPRLMGADLLGQVTVAMTIAGLGATATSLGISEYLVRRVAQHPASLRQDAGVALLVQTVPTLVGALVIALCLPAEAFSLADHRLLFVALLGMLISPAQTVLLSSFRGREMHAQYAWFNAAGVVVGQVGGLLALLAGADALAYVAILGGATIGTTIVGWQVSRLRPTLPTSTHLVIQECRAALWGSFPFLAWLVVQSVTGGIDRVLLGLLVPAAEVGWYAAAYRIFSIPVFIPTLIMTPLFPALSRSAREPEIIRRTVAKTARIVVLIVVPLCAGIIVVAPGIPSILGWPGDFANASPLIAILSLQLPIISLDMVLGSVLMAIGRQGRWVVVGIIAAVLKIGLNFAAIPVFENLMGNGAIGASVVTLLAELWMFFGALILIPKDLLDLRVARDIGWIFLAGLAAAVVGSILLHVGLVLAVVGCTITYLLMVMSFRALKMEDLRPVSDRVLAIAQATARNPRRQ